MKAPSNDHEIRSAVGPKAFFSGLIVFILIVAFMGSLGLIFHEQILAHITNKEVPKFDWSEFSFSLGGTIFTTIVVLITLQYSTSKRSEAIAIELTRLTTRNVINAVYTKNMPEEITNEVHSCMVNSDAFRTNYKLSFALEEINDGSAEGKPPCHKHCNNTKHYLMRGKIQYRIHNATDKKIEHTISIESEMAIEQFLRKYSTIEAIKVDGKARKFTPKKDDKFVSAHSKLKIPGKGFHNIDIEFTTVKRDVDMEVWAFSVPTVGVTVNLNVPANLSASATLNHAKPIASIDQAGAGNYTWETNVGFLPFQSILLWWYDPSKTGASG